MYTESVLMYLEFTSSQPDVVEVERKAILAKTYTVTGCWHCGSPRSPGPGTDFEIRVATFNASG